LFGLDLLSDGLAPTDFGDLNDYNEEAPFMPQMIDSTENVETPKNQQQSRATTSSKKPVARKSYQWGSTNPNQEAFREIERLKDKMNFNEGVGGKELREIMKRNITNYGNENNIDREQFEKFKRLPFSNKLEFIKEAEKFDIPDVEYSKDGIFMGKIIICNYERLHYFDSTKFDCVILDESSILKNFSASSLLRK
jgi:hypothetical protein